MNQDFEYLDALEQEIDLCNAEVAEFFEMSEDVIQNSVHSIFNLASNNTCDQIKRVELPKFNEDKKEYFTWTAVFMASIDSAHVTPEVKLLHLRQYLSGSAIKALEGLGHTKDCYCLVLELLERKFGGERRQTSLYLEQVNKFPIIKNNNPIELEKFSDILSLLILNLKKSNCMQ